MDLNLNANEARVLGALIEKELTTPEYYPMSLNALTNACNQKSNREPVMNLSESDITIAIDTLRDKKLVWQLSTSGGRVPKYEHNIKSLFPLSKQEIAIICTLLLRGPQTIGEIRTRSERMYSFASLEEAEQTIRELINRDDGPFITELPRQPGRKESRFAHLFSGIPETPEQIVPSEIYAADKTPHNPNTIERIESLEKQLFELKSEFNDFKDAFNELKKQLE